MMIRGLTLVNEERSHPQRSCPLAPFVPGHELLTTLALSLSNYLFKSAEIIISSSHGVNLDES